MCSKNLINLAIYTPLLLKIYKYLSSFKGPETKKIKMLFLIPFRYSGKHGSED